MPDDIRRFGDRLEPEVREAFLSAFVQARRLVPEEELLRLIRAGDRQGIIALAERLVSAGLIPATSPFVDAILAVAIAAGSTTATLLGASLTKTNDRVLTFIRSHGAQLVTGIADDVITTMRSVLSDSYQSGVRPREVALRITESIGLLPAHEQAAQRMADAGALPKAVSDYRQRMIRWRAETITRTETMIASHAGQLAGFQQAVADGLVDPKQVWVEWMVTEDDRLCERCAPMDGVRVRVGEKFKATHKGFPNGVPRERSTKPGKRRSDLRDEWLDGQLVKLKKPITVSHPPLHPNCRCTQVLRFEKDDTAGR